MIEQLLREHDSISDSIRNTLSVIILRDREALAEIFYREMMEDLEASKLLSASPSRAI